MLDIKYRVVLASKSPRRQALLKEIIPDFDIALRDIDEAYPATLKGAQIVEHIARAKADAFVNELADDQLLITADTIVWIDNQVLGKPKDSTDAIRMLNMLSGNMHTVYTGVCLLTTTRRRLFSTSTDVYFSKLSEPDIRYYVDNFRPFDKAGAYGIQEWIGYIGVERINGSYFNVMGLPVQKLYDELCQFCSVNR